MEPTKSSKCPELSMIGSYNGLTGDHRDKRYQQLSRCLQDIQQYLTEQIPMS